MRRMLFLFVLCVVVASGVGCQQMGGCNGGCGPGGGGGIFGNHSRHRGRHGGAGLVQRMRAHHVDPNSMGPPGPPTHTVNYPYYTLRAPRDFLAENPPSIGP